MQISSADLAGDVLQAFLIQVQKAKLDAEIAMQNIDRLMKANELNFAFIAVAPTLLVLAGTGAYLRGLWRRLNGKSRRRVELACRENLRTLHRILLQSSAEGEKNQGSTIAAEGNLLVETHHMRQLINELPAEIRRNYREDISDLERPTWDADHKMRIIERRLLFGV